MSVSSVLGSEKAEVDSLIEDDITHKMADDLLQSIEKKFLMDLQTSVDQVLNKIKVLLQDGTTMIQDKLVFLQQDLEQLKSNAEAGEGKINACLIQHQNQTVELSEKALHQMVLCGSALIGHDPGKALTKVMTLKMAINDGLKPLRSNDNEIVKLLKICGHNHDSLKTVIKCVISKSPLVKTTMMDITGKMLDGVVDLSKLMAHGAMHEACLIEVVKHIEDEAQVIVSSVRNCALDINQKSPAEELEKLSGDITKDKEVTADDTKIGNGKSLLRTKVPYAAKDRESDHDDDDDDGDDDDRKATRRSNI